MNENIRKLATESELMSIIEEIDLEIINAHDISRVEKFAELIVNETLRVAYEERSMPLSVWLAVKEHFGIKE